MTPPMPEKALVSLRGISKYFGEGETRIDALRDISLNVLPGPRLWPCADPQAQGRPLSSTSSPASSMPLAAAWPSTARSSMTTSGFGATCEACGWRRSASSSSFTTCFPFSTQPTMSRSSCSLRVWSLPRRRSGRSELLNYLEVCNRGNAFPAKLSGGEAQPCCDCTGAGQPPPHCPRRRAHGGPRLEAGTDRDGSLAQACGGPERGGDRRDPRREDFRSLRPHVHASRRPLG